ncbi:MAG: hypothetical protein ACJ72U_13935 [Nitrososphaeraceae archaeon]
MDENMFIIIFIYYFTNHSATQIKRLVTFVCISAIIATPLLITIKSSNNSNYNNQFLQQAFADHINTATSNETTILHQGIIASEPTSQVKSRPNEERQTVIILPFRNDVQPIKEF